MMRISMKTSHSTELMKIRNVDADCSIVCRNGVLKAHRVILAAGSPYFLELLTSVGMSNPVLFLTQYEKDDVQAIMDLLYSGSVYVDSDRMSHVVSAIQELRIKLSEDENQDG